LTKSQTDHPEGIENAIERAGVTEVEVTEIEIGTARGVTVVDAMSEMNEGSDTVVRGTTVIGTERGRGRGSAVIDTNEVEVEGDMTKTGTGTLDVVGGMMNPEQNQWDIEIDDHDTTRSHTLSP
jgi:hypothetical protein